MRRVSPKLGRAGPKRGDRPVAEARGFFLLVYALVARIPRGKVATYGQIGRLLGAPRAARVVGWAMHGHPRGRRVPCHRVVQQGGTCSPNFRVGDPGAQRRLLEREGVQFLLDGRIDMGAHQWRPELDGGRLGGNRQLSRIALAAPGSPGGYRANFPPEGRRKIRPAPR